MGERVCREIRSYYPCVLPDGKSYPLYCSAAYRGFSGKGLQYDSYALLPIHEQKAWGARAPVAGKIFLCFMDDQHLYRAIRYVERNPVRVGIVRDAGEYRWSSARVHAGIAVEALPIPIDTAGFAMSAGEWKRFLRAEDKEMSAEMRVKTGRGLAVGSERFKKTVARRLHRSLECLPPGRPKKSGK